MSSRRVGGAESCNDENIQGYHLGDGATYFYQSNDEYTDIFPYWDWKMIPGTTTFHDNVPLPVLPCSGDNIASDFVGGVSDGVNGIATLAYNRDSLTAQKSWFFFDDAIVCLGANINSNENKEVRTTLNQGFLQGDVLVKQNAVVAKIAAGEHKLDNVHWILHNNWGYYFPAVTNITLSNEEKNGDWHNVLKRMPAATMKASIFSLWINHGMQPKAMRYAYYIFPTATAGNIEARAGALAITENTATLQVVENNTKQMAGIVFVQPATATTKTFGKISASKPCILMLVKKYATLQLSIADPAHIQTSVVLILPGNKKCSAATAIYDKTNNQTSLTVSLPQGPEAGKTLRLIVE
jgi:chondroitin AC lyase